MKFVLPLVVALTVISVSKASVVEKVEAMLAHTFNGEIDGGILSTVRIVLNLCAAKNRNEAVAQGFYGCYDSVPNEKDEFVKCQTEAFDRVLDTEENVSYACKNWILLPKYAGCLKREFNGREQEMNDAVTTVNKCQAVAVGIKQ